MPNLTPHDVTIGLLALGTLLLSARTLAEVAKRFNQPAILGEILTGVVLGPSILGALRPDWTHFLFPATGGSAVVLDVVTTLGITLFLFVAGIEVDLSAIRRQRQLVFAITVGGIVVPFALGFATAWYIPGVFGPERDANPMIFALFLATALSISALPVIAKTLMDLNLYRTNLGTLIITAGFINDLVSVLIFVVILGMTGAVPHVFGTAGSIVIALGFAATMCTAGRSLIHQALPWIETHTSRPGGVLGFALGLALLSAAFTEWLGIHAILGAFLAGVAFGDSAHLHERTRTTIKDFVSSFFVPVFFATIGLRIDFITQFDWLLSLTLLIVACLGKLLGCGLSAQLNGMARREAWAIGFGMNARGAMEIIFGLLGWRYGVISERVFVALVVLAIVTSMMSGPMMRRLLKLKKPRRLVDYLAADGFLQFLRTDRCDGAIRELSRAAADVSGLGAEAIERSLLAGELVTPKALRNGIVIVSTQTDGRVDPLVGIGLSRTGVACDHLGGEPVHFVFIVLAAQSDNGACLDILEDIERTFGDATIRARTLQLSTPREFLRLLRSAAPEDPAPL